MSTSVIILGGGVAGMSAAHELAERGFAVTVFERHSELPGGKARSLNVNDPLTEKNLPLPGEHGFRFFPGFYRHVTDTMKRIPYQDPVTKQFNKEGVFGNLVECPKEMMLQMGKTPIVTLSHFPRSLSDLRVLMTAFHANTGLNEEEKKLIEDKVWQLMTSCYDRRQNEYEHVGWWEFTDADNQRAIYQTLFTQGLTRTLVAARATDASTKTGGDIFLQLLYGMANPFTETADRVLCGPTNDVWLIPWLNYLQGRGVQYHFGNEVKSFECDHTGISGVWVSQQGAAPQKFTADYYISAMPVERIAKLLNDQMIKLDPCLAHLQTLAASVAWMNGVQFYLSSQPDLPKAHVILADSPWAVTAISQVPFWRNFDIAKYGDGAIRSIISVDVSDWDTPGLLYGKAAKDCNREEVIAEIWEQMKRSFNVDGKMILQDVDRKAVNIDRDIKFGSSAITEDEEPLLVNTTDSWALRTEAYTAMPNFFLASDFVKTFTDLATMEGANEAARRAVNCIIDATGVKAPLCKIWNLHEPDLLLYYKWLDQRRYNKGLPWKAHEILFPGVKNVLFQKLRKIF